MISLTYADILLIAATCFLAGVGLGLWVGIATSPQEDHDSLKDDWFPLREEEVTLDLGKGLKRASDLRRGQG